MGIFKKKIKDIDRDTKLKISKILRDFTKEVPEFQSACVVRIDDGVTISSYSLNSYFKTHNALINYTMFIKEHLNVLKQINPELSDDTEDILITMKNGYFFLMMLGKRYYFGLAIGKKGNPGLTKIIMKKYEPLLMEMLREPEK